MQLSTRSAEIYLSQAGRQVLAALLQPKSMPFPELESLLNKPSARRAQVREGGPYEDHQA